MPLTVWRASSYRPVFDTLYNYKLVNAANGKAIDISGSSTADGAKVVQATFDGRPSQLFLTKDNRRMLDGAGTVFLGADANHPGQGGQSFYEENGQLYMVYHAYTRPTGDPLISVRPVFFDATDWPTLNACQTGN